jgi:hypothetical protein
MARRELHTTLVEAIDALSPPTGTGLIITGASLDLPLELVAATDRATGQPVIAGSAPHSRWDSGFLPPVHVAHVEIELLDTDDATPRRRDGG